MAYTFKGAAVTPVGIIGNDQLIQNIFTIENGIFSRVNVIIKRLVVQLDPIIVLTSVMPLIKSSRITSTITGGITLPKVPFDTSKNSDTNVIIRTSISSGNPIIATASTTQWEKYGNRLHSLYGQVSSEDANEIPNLAENANTKYILKPGEKLLVYIEGPSVASNSSLANNWFAQCVWEEEEINTFPISGTVTLHGSPINNAKIIIIESTDKFMSNPTLIDVKTTTISGTWNSIIASGRIGAAFTQYTISGVYYTAPGNPYLEQ
jgi:hypothetical protein